MIMTTAYEGATTTNWDYLQGTQGVVLVTRIDGRPRAVIELCPRAGFRLTDCRDGSTATFLSLDEAKQEYERRR
jgi:hypothetical protein